MTDMREPSIRYTAPKGIFVYGIRFVSAGAALLVAMAYVLEYMFQKSTNCEPWALLLGLLAIAGINYLISRDILYPAFLFSAVWFMAAAVYVFLPFEINPISWTTVSIFLVGQLSFSFGCVLGNRPISKGPTWFLAECKNSQPRRLLLAYCIFIVPVVLYNQMNMAGVFSLTPEFFIAARAAILERQEEGRAIGSVFFAYAPTIAISTAFCLILEETNRYILAAGIGVAIILGILTTGRTVLLLFFCGWLMFTLLGKSDRSITAMARKLAVIGVAILLALTLTTLLTKNETQKEHAGDKSALEVAANLTAIYIAGPLAGFDYVVQHPDQFRDQSNNTFSQILSPLSVVLGFRYHRPPAFEPFSSVPFPMNVYTAFKTYFVDFGVIGCILAFLLFGLISGYLFHTSRRGNWIAKFFFAYLFYAMLFTPFQDVYHSFNRYVYMTAFGLLYFFISRHTWEVNFVLTKRRLG